MDERSAKCEDEKNPRKHDVHETSFPAGALKGKRWTLSPSSSTKAGSAWPINTIRFGPAPRANSSSHCSTPPRSKPECRCSISAADPGMSPRRPPNAMPYRSASIFQVRWSPSRGARFQKSSFTKATPRILISLTPRSTGWWRILLCSIEANPERACAEACRALKAGGWFGFTTWARMEQNPFVKLVDDAIQAHANLNVDLPPGPPYYLFESPEEFRSALERAGFDGASMSFKVHRIEWKVPTASFIFEAELNAGVRTAGLLARQTPEVLRAIRAALEKAVKPYARGNGFAIPKAAYVVAARKARPA